MKTHAELAAVGMKRGRVKSDRGGRSPGTDRFSSPSFFGYGPGVSRFSIARVTAAPAASVSGQGCPPGLVNNASQARGAAERPAFCRPCGAWKHRGEGYLPGVSPLAIHLSPLRGGDADAGKGCRDRDWAFAAPRRGRGCRQGLPGSRRGFRHSAAGTRIFWLCRTSTRMCCPLDRLLPPGTEEELSIR
jgi:hypothetical protein